MSDDIKNIFNKLVELSKENDLVINLHDNFDIELNNTFVIETTVVGFTSDGVIVETDESMLEFLDLNGALLEAEYQGRKVTLNKPMQGDVKKSKVYVTDPKTKKVKKINFGDKDMRIKKSNPERRKSFRARHKCDTAKDKTTARYWSCRKW